MRKMVGVALVIILAVIGLSTALSACGGDTDADVASSNLSKAAEQFEVERRIVFYNGITDKYLLTIEGLCSIETNYGKLEVTCKMPDDGGKPEFKKSYLGLSDNVTYIVEQMKAQAVSTSQYRVIFKPEAIVPDFDRP
jgi:hypothetical protein